MKKILFITSTLEVGGIETYLLRFLRSNSILFNSTVLCKSGKSGILESEYIKTNTNIITFKLGYFSLKEYWNLYNYLKHEKFDTLCDFTGDFAGLVLFISKLAGVKNRLVFYRGSEYQFKITFFKLLYAKFMNYLVKKFASKILSNSNTALNNFHKGWEENLSKYEVIYNGIPTFNLISKEKRESLRKEIGIPEENYLIGHVGRFTPAKNHPHILKVIKAILKRNSKISFYLCGTNVKTSLEDIVKNLGISNNVFLDNSRSDISELLQCFDIFYFPSLNEGQPNALLEAMSFGIPFVASNIESIKETIPNHYLSNLVDNNDLEKTIYTIENLINNISEFQSDELSLWTKENYKSEKLFKKFLKNLQGEEV